MDQSRSEWKIRARVTRMWVPRGVSDNQFSMNMILLDNEVNSQYTVLLSETEPYNSFIYILTHALFVLSNKQDYHIEAFVESEA